MEEAPIEMPQSLTERFFRAARRVLLKETNKLIFDPADMLLIADDIGLQAEFREMFRNEVNNPQLADIIVHYLEDMASDLEGRAAISDIDVDMIDRAGMAVSASVTVAAIGMVVVSGGALVPVLLFVGGLVGLGLAGTGRTLLKRGSHRHRMAARKVQRLSRGLETNR
jgi:hypothetical protein